MPFSPPKRNFYLPLIAAVGKGVLFLISAVSLIFAQERVFTISDNKVLINPSDAPVFQHFMDDAELPLAGIACLFQDSKGFLWVGSYMGLHRFDGYRFVTYKKDWQDKNAISAANITSIYETRAGQIWVGTADGLNFYDRANDNFKVYKFDAANPKSLSNNYVLTVFEDRRGTLWIGTSGGGLSRFDVADQSFTNFRLPNEKSNFITALTEDENGGFWIGTHDGLYQFDREDGAFQKARADSENPNKNIIRSMILDRENFIWIGTQDGLNKFNPATKQFTHYAADKSNPRSLSDNVVRSIFESKSGAMWVGTNAGLNHFNRETGEFTVYKHDKANPQSLSEGDILTILEDNTGQLWVGNVSGLNKFNQRTNRFQRFRHDPKNPFSISQDQIMSVFEDSRKNLWVGTRSSGQSGELNKYNPAEKRFEVVKMLGDAIVYAITEDRAGRLWFGTFKGLSSYDAETGRLTEYDVETSGNLPKNVNPQSIITIKENRAGQLLLGTIGGGMSIFDPASGKFSRFRYKPDDAENQANDRVYEITEDRSGHLWIATGGGLFRFNPETRKITEYRHDANNPQSLSANDVGTIYEDRNGVLWIGTTSGGLNRFDRETESFTHFTERDGLPSNDVFQIMEDEQGNLWLCTDRGLARFNVETKAVRVFTVNDGVPNNPFDNKTAFKDRNGTMYFGGQDGFVRFNPKDFADSRFKPPIYLTEIRVLEQPLKTVRNFTELDELNLSWRDYVVSFDFAALDFTVPKTLQYEWKLEGFDRDWIHGGTRRTATYTNLRGGDYVLKVRATNSDGVWTEESLNLKITVTPPFYQTWWFLILSILVVIAIVTLIFYLRFSQLKKIAKAQTEYSRRLIESQEQERKRIASELHDGLGQSLAIISNRAAMGKNNLNEPEITLREFDEISQNALEALDEVQQITSNLHPQYLERLGLTKALKAMFAKLADVIEIKSEIDLIDNIFPKESEINVYRIVQESLNNVVKHSDASEAEIKILKVENEVIITIKDDGRGFDTANFKSKGSGLGLVGLRERTKMLGGRISIDSSLGNGTEIRVNLPVKI